MTRGAKRPGVDQAYADVERLVDGAVAAAKESVITLPINW